ncbi:MAG: hypothetical protein V3S24_14090 [Candidatus Tectomicrobia bacterium]
MKTDVVVLTAKQTLLRLGALAIAALLVAVKPTISLAFQERHRLGYGGQTN